jgi:signal transduction histidine kinase
MGPFLGMPILARDVAIGHFYLARRPGRQAFDEQDERIVRLIAGFVATAIANVTLNRSVQNAIEEREEMISIISHDLRSPLNIIQLSAARVQKLRPGGDEGELAAIAQRIAVTAGRMNHLIDNLVDVTLVKSHALRARLAPQPPASIVMEAIDLLQPLACEKSIDLRAAVEPVPLVICESELILRVLWNLISNSIKFTPPGGSITVSARSAGSEVSFAVRDNGAGIAEDQLPHLFERFWRADLTRRGAGLGLYISKGIVDAHGGQMGAESCPGAGTTVWFTLRAHHPPSDHPRA